MISKDKQYKTKCGYDVRIYATDGELGGEIHGAMKGADEQWSSETWTKDGRYFDISLSNETDFDLIEVNPRIKREYWVNVREDGSIVSFHDLKKDADEWRDDEVRSCVKVVIDCEEGEGL